MKFPKLPKCFFGWTNLKWLIKEFIAMYSTRDSYFSKKRFESSIAFLSGVGIILSYVWLHRFTIQNSEVLADAAILLGMAGYAVNQIQKEKKDIPNPNFISGALNKDATQEGTPAKDDGDLVA